MKIDVLCDLQFGSTGKGAIAGFLARENRYDAAISINMPNAGHTFIDEQGNKFVQHVLPSALASKECTRGFIGPGAVFDPEQLEKEMSRLYECGYNPIVFIHENAWVWDQTYADNEYTQGLGSTRSGSGIAQVAKISRGNGWDGRTAGEILGHKPIANCYVLKHRDWRYGLQNHKKILLEGSQGWSLSLNGPFYPYVTTRDCTPARFMSDAMVPLNALNKVYGVMRVFPIRVGGDSGPWYTGQMEYSWDELGLEPEYTTTTGRMRRIADFSHEQIEEAVWHCGVDRLILTHCDQDSQRAASIVKWVEEKYGSNKLLYVSSGPTVNDVDIAPWPHWRTAE